MRLGNKYWARVHRLDGVCSSKGHKVAVVDVSAHRLPSCLGSRRPERRDPLRRGGLDSCSLGVSELGIEVLRSSDGVLVGCCRLVLI
ncbi:unnamed protein product [Protopolystoma xenopodis]|uniref:Uncharacterized protein n=1 Tax=Protopolystoma xenopodis TaxID=117903 RepID=A0A448XRB6_9PLAT|nr:unnamed protein product [Protopolystoma xenopodis]